MSLIFSALKQIESDDLSETGGNGGMPPKPPSSGRLILWIIVAIIVVTAMVTFAVNYLLHQSKSAEAVASEAVASAKEPVASETTSIAAESFASAPYATTTAIAQTDNTNNASSTPVDNEAVLMAARKLLAEQSAVLGKNGNLPAEVAPAAKSQAVPVPTEPAVPTAPVAAKITPEPVAAPVKESGIKVTTINNTKNSGTGSDVSDQRSGDTVKMSNTDMKSVSQVTANLTSALQSKDMASARLALGQLEKLLPAESLTLLRMNAWYSQVNGDRARAKSQYQQILNRVPEDENAGVNLVMLQIQDGQIDAAKELLGQLSNRYPESKKVARVRQALASTQQ